MFVPPTVPCYTFAYAHYCSGLHNPLEMSFLRVLSFNLIMTTSDRHLYGTRLYTARTIYAPHGIR